LEVDVARFPAVDEWVGRLEQRPSIAAEIDVVASL
jgi:glutathione S-transferase